MSGYFGVTQFRCIDFGVFRMRAGLTGNEGERWPRAVTPVRLVRGN